MPPMARPRRPGKGDAHSSSSNGSTAVESSGASKHVTNIISKWKQIVAFFVLTIATWFSYRGYLETRVITPFDDTRLVIQSGLDIPRQFWGSYRPGVYFGLKTRDPQSLVTGLMWYFPSHLRPGGEGIRHWCEQGDNLERYGWLQHDGYDFGVQQIVDGNFLLNTSFVKRIGGDHGGDWSARISVNYLNTSLNVHETEEVSLIWYVALDENGEISATNSATKYTGIRGRTDALDHFTVRLSNHSGAVLHDSFVSTSAPGLHLLKETIFSSLRLKQISPDGTAKGIVLAGELPVYGPENKLISTNFVAVQLCGRIPFTMDVAFESDSFVNRDNHMVGDVYTEAIDWHQIRYRRNFEDIFGLKKKGFIDKEIEFAEAAVSNMIGGIGYFYGSSKVKSEYTQEAVHYWPAPLFTAVPSRSFFPRGFLWDEGFHGLLLSAWDVDLELDIICHWFDLMNVEGWIAREQILGVEALAKVPSEFVVQHNANANPPTFFITLQWMIRNGHFSPALRHRLDVLERLYPRLQAWFHWFNNTQKGTRAGTYRWRGRDPSSTRELNPKTLTSGLDDYPRASHPTTDEYHVDLYCWMALASQVLASIADILGHDGYKYEQHALYLMNNDVLNDLHWSKFANAYADYGYHTDGVILKRPKVIPRSQNQNMEMVRIVTKKPEYRLVDTAFGYVSLFPFLLQILDADSLQLTQILEDLPKPDLLWTPYGLRSLARTSTMYMKRNTEHDPPYWRGQIWMNMNYLAVRALYYYGYEAEDGPNRNQSRQLYEKLRSNLIGNIMTQYWKTGYLWEQYNDETGKGSGCRPFTGWTSLVVLLMGEIY